MKLKLKIARIGYTQCYMEWVVTKMESDQNCLILERCDLCFSMLTYWFGNTDTQVVYGYAYKTDVLLASYKYVIYFREKGAGNQCCYGPNYKLIKNKSTPDRSHDWGSKPYNMPLRVPSASHWLVDIIPIFYCCKWGKSKDCQRYLRLRPAKVEPKYQHPKFGTWSTQSHIVTCIHEE